MDVTTNVDGQLELLEWDSHFFELKVGRVRLNSPTVRELAEVVQDAERRRIECLYWLVEAEDLHAPRVATICGFRLVDIRVTLEHDLAGESFNSAPSPPVKVRSFVSADLTSLLAIASTSHGDSRFFHDGNFPKEKCAALYETWLEHATSRTSEHVLVAEIDDVPAGYCTCRRAPEGSGAISLIAVDASHRRAGVGRALVLSALDYFRKTHAIGVTVVTQGRNIASQRLYQRCGFIPHSMAFWYHRWRSEVS